MQQNSDEEDNEMTSQEDLATNNAIFKHEYKPQILNLRRLYMLLGEWEPKTGHHLRW